MSAIRIYNTRETEYQTLKLFADMVNAVAFEEKVGIYMEVHDTYFDYGQNWKYTTLLTEDFIEESRWQSFCPRDYELILNTDSIAKLKIMAIYYVEKYKEERNAIIDLYEIFE